MPGIANEPSDEDAALIAQLLAEDNPYADALDSGTGSYYEKPKRRRKGRQGCAKGGGKVQATSSTAAGAEPQTAGQRGGGLCAANADGAARDAAVTVSELTATGRKRRRDTGVARPDARSWTEEEERLFREGLELHGRDWAAVASHIGSRDAKSVTSHTQKYLVKLCMEGRLLPRKMAESGAGYTLSGKLLDPDSASARAYGLKPSVTARLRSESAASLVGMTPPKTDENGDIIQPAPQPKKSQPAPNSKAKAKQRPKLQQQHQEAELDSWQAERTEYALARPRRETAARSAVGGTTESLELVRCLDFVGPPGSGAPLAQPFSLEVHPSAMVMMDFHAHLSSVEIIGLLGGRWHSDSKRLIVAEAFPCRSAQGSESGVSVELDPEHEVQTRALMHERGLVSVGWYHSHPVFDTTPSLKDCENQRNYQALFRDTASSEEPFVAAIIGPYDPQLPDQRSALSWFSVKTRLGDTGRELVPYNLQFATGARAVPTEEETAKLLRLAERTIGDHGRVNLAKQWRPFTRLVDGRPDGPAPTRLEKLRGALRAHMPPEAEEATIAWLDSLAVALTA